MARPVRPGTIQAAVGASLRAGGGLEAAAADLGVSLSVLSYGTELREDRPGGLGVNYLDRLGRIDRAAALPIAQHFAQLAGGVFQPVDLTGALAADVAALTLEFSDVLARHAEAHSASSADPTGYTPAEAALQVKELDDLVRVVLRMRAAMLARVEGTA